MTDRSRPDYPAKIADFLDDIASRIRSMTVDRAAVAVTWTAIGIVVAAVAALALIWFLISFFRALGTLIGQEWAYLVVGGILLLVGVLVWVKRYPDEESAPPQE
jgi:predicted membrane channel-forming protein YqfA (hemolysin III family)